MAGIEEAFEKFVKKISDIEEKDTEDNSNFDFGKNVYAPQGGLFFSPVQKNQIPFGDILKSDQRLNPPMPTPMQRNLSSEERMRLEDNEYFMGQGQPQYVSPVVQGQGFNKRDLKDFTKQYLQSQTPLGGGIGYQGPEYGVMGIKPFVGPDRSALLQAYYNTDNEGSKIQAMLSPKEQQIGYTGNTGTTFSAGRNTFQGSPYYTLNLSKSFADGGVASMFRERPRYQVGGTIDPLLALQRNPFDQYGFSDPVISALTGNIFTSGQRFRDVTDLSSGPDIQRAQSLGYSQPEIQELGFQRDMLADYRRALSEASLGSTFQANPEKTALDLATSLRQMYMNPTPPPVQQQRPQTQYQYSSKGTPILQYGYTGTPSAELQSQIDLQKRALDRLESIYNKPMANIGGDERVHAFGNTGGYKYNQNELLQNILRSEQEAAARVTPTKKADGGLASFNQGGQVKSYEEQTLNKKGYETTGMSKKEIFDLYDSVMGTFSRRFADGGRVSMSDGGLTNTIPPDKGPDSQGVESLFRRRYN